MDVLIASNERDAKAADMVVEHHAQMAGALALNVEELVGAAARADEPGARRASDRLLAWCRDELMPHALAEEQALYPKAEQTVEGKLLIRAMIDEHGAIKDHIARIADAKDPVRAAVAATALEAVFTVHLTKENEQLLPLLAATPGVSIAESLDQMHEHLAPEQSASEQSAGHDAAPAPVAGSCACGHHDEPGVPELDVQTIPHAIRHATIFGALDALASGGALIISATHDPVPLLSQLQQRSPGAFEAAYLQRGPERWKVQFDRR